MIITKKQVLSALLLSALSLSIIGAGCRAQNSESLLNSQTGLTEIGAQAYGNKTAVDIRTTAGKIINLALGFLATIFVALIIVAGFQYMTAGGNDESTKKALSLLKNAIIGLLIIIVSWALARFLLVVFNRTARNAVDYTNASGFGR